jgi:hypothetical protein
MLARSKESRKSAQDAKPAHVYKSSASQKRKRVVKMSIGVIAAGTLIAVVAILAIGRSTAPAPVDDNGASHADPNSVATIILRSPTSGCQQKSFNNQTGQISGQTSPCRNDVILDAKGLPVPTGTIRTLNSISKSFK